MSAGVGVRTLRFTIPRKPVSVNRAYLRAGFGRNRGSGGGKGFILSREARDFKGAVSAHGFAAAAQANWPRPERVQLVDLEVVTWNTRHDADAPVKLLQDALEGVLYVKDRVVRKVSASKAKDAGLARIDVAVTLIEESPCPPVTSLASRRARNAAAQSSTPSASPADPPSSASTAARAADSSCISSPAKNQRGHTAD